MLNEKKLKKHSAEEVKKEKERRKREAKKEMEQKGVKIGLVVMKNYHPKDCGCFDCLTLPEPFCPFPEEHEKFVKIMFRNVRREV